MMKHKYDIWSMDWRPEKREEDHHDAPDSDKKIGNEPSGVDLFHVFLWTMASISIVAIVFCLIRIPLKSSSKTIISRIDPYRKSSDLHQSGLRFAAMGEYDKAIDCFSDAIALSPPPPDPDAFYLERGKCHEAKGDFLLALADYDWACRHSMGAVDERNALLLRFAEAEIQAGNLPKALDYFTHSLVIDDYCIMEWRMDFHCRRRLQTYDARKRCLENSDDPLQRLLALADSYWMEINNAYLRNTYSTQTGEILHSLDQDGAFLLGFAEWHYGQKNYALALECLRQTIAKKEFSELPSHMQESFQNLKITLDEMLQEGVPAGVFSHTSMVYGITISASPPPPQAQKNMESNASTENE